MDVKNYDFTNAEEFDQLCEDAARAVYHPAKSQGQYAMQLVIQNMVMPRGTTGFDEKKMKAWITRKLQVIMATRTVLNGREE